MLTVAISKRNKLQNIIVLTPKDGSKSVCEPFPNRFHYEVPPRFDNQMVNLSIMPRSRDF